MSRLLTRHYRTLRSAYGYAPPVTPVGPMSREELQARFTCVDNAEAFADSLTTGDPVSMTVGVTPTGPPHVGTFGQFRIAARLQDAGLPVQVVIADLAAVLAGGHPEATVVDRTHRYRAFAAETGVAPDSIRTQTEATDVLTTALSLSRFLDPDEDGDPPTRFDTAVREAYDTHDTPGRDHSPVATTVTTLLLVADTLHPLIATDCRASAIVVGADNHGLSRRFRAVLDRSPWTGTVAGFYTPLVPGDADIPKVSKSLPHDAFSLEQPPERLAETVRALEPGPTTVEDTVLAATRLLCRDSPETIAAIRSALPDGETAWRDARTRLAAELERAARTWRATADDPTNP